MQPHEVLAELDRLGITVWWDESRVRSGYPTSPTIRIEGTVPEELRVAIREHNDHLLKIMRTEVGERNVGIRHRRPHPPGTGW